MAGVSREGTDFVRTDRLCLMCLIGVVLSLGFMPELKAQEWTTQRLTSAPEPLETDRDSFTPATSVVGPDRTLVETSYSFLDNRRTSETHSFPELLVRVGLSDRVELRLGWNYEVGGGGAVSGADGGFTEESRGNVSEAEVLFGLKTTVTEQRGWLPASAVILQGYTPTAGPENNTDIVVGTVVGWRLPGECQLDASLRYGTENTDGDHFNQWAPSVVFKVPVRERWNVHAEYFGIFSQNLAEDTTPQYFSPGVHYLLSPDCEIGVRVGWGLSDDAAAFFSNVGLGLRF
jgi:hypothetical protein